jgi:3-deoxy-D-manno-octulosonic-acid transferase
MLAAAAPDLLVFTKLDLWPELATRAAVRGARTALVAATVNRDSGRLRWPARWLARNGYHVLDHIAAITADDATRLVRLGCRRERIELTGDPRVDAVLQATESTSGEVVLDDPDVTLIAGSTWPEDESVLLAAFARVRAAHPRARLVLAPHEPTRPHLAHVDSECARIGLPEPRRLGAIAPGDRPAIVLVDRIGVLARLYAAGMLAYVGGGFGDKGIHSVFEPAAWSRPVIIGPRDRGSRDAALLETAGALTRLPATAAAAALATQWIAALGDPGAARAAGARARAALEPDRGAAARTATLLAGLLARPAPG